MPTKIEKIIKDAEKLALHFERHEPAPDAFRDAAALREIRKARRALVHAKECLSQAVENARAKGHSWASIGAMLGISAEAASSVLGGERTSDLD
ncbi:MAG: hypothetical protein WD354_01280 [Acidimicrobiia bacterium]